MCIECVVRWNGEEKNLTNDFRKNMHLFPQLDKIEDKINFNYDIKLDS